MASKTPPPNAGVLAAFASAASRLRSQPAALRLARESLVPALGEQGMVDAGCVAALFAGISRIVDATGLPDEKPEEYEQMEQMLTWVVPGVMGGLLGMAYMCYYLLLS